jgi:hypothetical protein
MIPYYFWVKLIFFVFLFAPQTRGSIMIYNSVVRPFLDKYKDKINSIISDVQGSASELAKEAKKEAVSQLNNPQNLIKGAQVLQQA